MDGRTLLRALVWSMIVCVALGHDLYEEFGEDRPSTEGAIPLRQEPGNDEELFPATYAVWFDHGGVPVHYSLVRDDRMTEALNPSVFRLASFLPDDLMTDDNDNEFAFYHNGESEESEARASFVLHRCSTTEEAKLYGNFRVKGEPFVMGHEQGVQHRVKRAAVTSKVFDVDNTTNVIEVFVWSAPDVLNFHKKRLELGPSATEKRFLRVWERAIIRDVDLIFRRSTNLRVYYMGGGNDRSEQTTWYRNNVQGDLMKRDAVDDVTEYLKLQIANNLLDEYDHAVVLTRQDVTDTFAGRGQDKISYGTAGSICDPTHPKGFSVSLAEVSSPFFVKAVAQSMIFAFDASYNFMADPYSVMSRDVEEDVPFDFRASRWTIDPVTADRIQKKVDNLTDNCLLTRLPGFDFDDFLSTNTYGDEFPSLDDQCQILVGAASGLCDSDAATICYNGSLCFDPLASTCTLPLFTGDLTECDVDRSCRYGSCIENSLVDKSTSTSTSSSTSTSTTTTVPTTTEPIPDCCCEVRDIGKVNVNFVMDPCGAD